MRRRTHTVRRPSAAKSSSTRSAAGGAVPGPRVSSTSGEPLERGQHVEADRAAAAVEGVQRAVRAQQRDRAALERRPLGIGAGVDQQPWDLALGLVLVARVEAGPRGQRAQLVGDDDLARDDHEPVVSAAGRGRGGVLGALARVLVPAAPALAPQAPGRHHPRAQRRGAPARLAEAELVEGERDLVADVDPHEVLELEGAHAKAGGAHDRVDGLDVGHALLQELERLEAEGPVAAVDQEPGAVGGVDDLLAHRPPGRAGDLERLGRGVDAGDDLDEAHDGRGVEEVHADHAPGVGRRAGDRGDRDRGGVGREHGARRDLAQGREELALELEALGRGLDDEPRLRQVGQLGRGRDLARLALQAALRPPALEAVGDLLQAALARLGHGVVQQRARARRGRELRDPGAHGPGADDADDLWHPAHVAEAS